MPVVIESCLHCFSLKRETSYLAPFMATEVAEKFPFDSCLEMFMPVYVLIVQKEEITILLFILLKRFLIP